VRALPTLAALQLIQPVEQRLDPQDGARTGGGREPAGEHECALFRMEPIERGAHPAKAVLVPGIQLLHGLDGGGLLRLGGARGSVAGGLVEQRPALLVVVAVEAGLCEQPVNDGVIGDAAQIAGIGLALDDDDQARSLGDGLDAIEEVGDHRGAEEVGARGLGRGLLDGGAAGVVLGDAE